MKMSFEVFQDKVNALIKKAGGEISVYFISNGSRFLANCSDGTTIVGNSGNRKATVRWGSGHQAMVAL